jgi:AAA domain
VLYLALEDNKRRLKSRLDKLLGETHPGPDRLYFHTEMPRLASGGLDVIKTWIASVEHPRLIIIDTLAMVRAPSKQKEQTQYDANYAAVLELRTLANEHKLAVVVVHHLRKMDADDAFDTISGTLGLSGAPDSVLVMKRDNSGAIALYGTGRDLPEIEKALSFDRESCLWRIAGDLSGVRKSAERSAVLVAMQEINAPASAREIAAYTRLKTVNVHKMLQRMVAEGAVRRPARGKYQYIPETTERAAEAEIKSA